MERNEALRDKFVEDIGRFGAHHLVFVDESAVDRRTPHRAYGWAPSGERAEMPGCFVRGARYDSSKCRRTIANFVRSYSLLPALSLDGIIYSTIKEGSFDGSAFTDFITNLLEVMQPYPAPNSVLVMDNCAIHKVEGIRELVEAR